MTTDRRHRPTDTTRWLELQTRLSPTRDEIERRLGAALSRLFGPADLCRLGWRQVASSGAWYRDLGDTPRDLVAALGCAYLAALAARPELWGRVLAFDGRGRRALSGLPLGASTSVPREVGDEVAFARLCGALFCAHRTMRPRRPWAKVPPIERSLEALARAHLPPAGPSAVMDCGIAPDYIAAFGTAAE